MKEIIELRKEREKHYLNNDGTVTAYMYNEDIHYLENGEYKEIDNTLVEEDGYITNKANNFKIRLNKNKYLVKIELNEKEYLNISLRNANAVSAHILNNEVMYKEILSNIDIQYLVHGKTLKENIILKDKLNSNIVFNIETNLELVISDSKVLAKNGDNIIYVFNPLFMIDAKEQINNNCNYKLTKLENGYELEFILDEKYLIEAEYPIVIDPTVTTDNLENVEDFTLYSSQPDHAAANTNYLSVGSDANGIMRTLLKFDLPKIATGNNIIKATAYLKHFGSYINENPKTIGVYEVTTNWSESTATWNNMNNNYNPKMETYLTPPQMVDTNSSFDIDLTNIVKRWYSDKENKGIMLKCLDESYDSTMPYYSFYSKTYDGINGTAYRPLLTIDYRLQNGLQNYMTYESLPFSIGTCYINNCTGNLTNTIYLSEILDNTCLFDLMLTYNTHDVVMNNNIKYGLGFNLSYNETIEETINKFMTKEYKYTCADGTSHYFYRHKNEDGTYDTLYHDEDGLSLTLEIKNDTTKEFVLKDKNSNVYNFANGYLSKIEYIDKTYVTITRDSENKITSIKDSKNNEVTISYFEDKVVFAYGSKNITINIKDNKLISIVVKKGNINIEYNSHSLISKIVDTNGLSIGVDYYNIEPYKVSKITEFGLNNEEGKSKSFVYEFNSTTVTDNQNIKMRYTFNNLGNTVSTMLLSSDNSLKNAFGFSNTFVNELKMPETNKILASSLPIKYGENLIENGSFEGDSKNLFSLSKSNEDSYTGSYSVKIEGYTIGELDRVLEKDKTYTFSAYFKNSNAIDIQVYGTRATGQDIIYEETIMPNSEFTKCDFTFDVTYGYSCVGFILDVRNDGIAYMDDVVINESNIANNCNLIDNSNFAKGIDGWDVYSSIDGSDDIVANPYEIITLPSNEKAIQLNSIVNGSVSLLKTLNISGKKGDTFTFSFWYKNEGVLDTIYNMVGNLVSLTFFDSNSEFGECINNAILNYHADNWQFYTETCIAENDFDSIDIRVLSIYEANHLFVTNFSLIKNSGSFFYEYDEEGNLISTIYPDNGKFQMNYDSNNQLIGMFNAKGNNFTYEYDNTKTNRLLKGISPTGISNEIKYDAFGNPVGTIINNVNPNGKNISGNYYIRAKGTNKYVTPNLNTKDLLLKNDVCSHYSFTIASHDEIDDQTTIKLYNFASSILPRYVLIKVDSNIVLNKSSIGTDFELIRKNNGSYNIKVYKENLYLKAVDDKLTLMSLEDNSDFEFYFEDVNTNEFIETKAEYTEDGKYITKITDTLGNRITYNINNLTGLADSITNAKNIETDYTYDEKNRLKSVTLDNKIVNYAYNGNVISNIQTGKKQFNFEYDAFLKPTKIKINNNTLVTKEYENKNGQLKNVNYGNGDKVSYEYDNFDRLKRTIKNNNVYENYYDNFGLLNKVSINSSIKEKYCYDFANRLSSYIYYDKFRFNYKYDENSNVNHKDYVLYNDTYKLDYDFNEDGSIVKVKFDGNSLNYIYDNLGRIKSKNINDKLPIEYTYKKNGKKTSLTLESMKIDSDVYNYTYDNLYNITKIVKNDEVINEYTYDNRSELLIDINYELNKKYIYTYDDEGNILSKEEYDLETNTLLNKDTFSYENTKWEDQLTKYNNESITYDNIGNPLTIGSKILTWVNGRELSSYKDGNLVIKYNYDKKGIRTSKEIGETKINYYLEGSKIVFEESNNDVIYYIYDDSDNVLGFKYKENTYYYQKNYQNDIIGIYDSNYNLVVSYNYDAWGRILSIVDNTIDKIGTINPFRYRSYYYDEESKLYYLNSRYYNPKWCRFINADGIVGANQDILSLNLYAYVSNNPCNGVDIEGSLLFRIVMHIVAKKLKNSISMFMKSLVKHDDTIKYDNKSSLAKSLKKSKTINNIVNNNLEDFKKSNEKSKQYSSDKASSFYKNFSEVDLALSVGSFNYDMIITESKENYIVDVSIGECYDFELWPKDKKFALINNMGYALQEAGIVKPYYWDVKFQIILEKEE